MSALTFESVIEFIENLSLEEQKELFHLVEKRRIERQRSEITENARKTFEALDQGTAKRRTAEEIKSYLLADEEE